LALPPHHPYWLQQTPNVLPAHVCPVTTPAEVVPQVPSPLTLRVAEGLAEVDVFVELVVDFLLLVVGLTLLVVGLVLVVVCLVLLVVGFVLVVGGLVLVVGGLVLVVGGFVLVVGGFVLLVVVGLVEEDETPHDPEAGLHPVPQ
jgi:hypothetical protein